MVRRTPSPVTYDGPERRAHPRIPAAAVPHLRASVAGGPPVRLIDLSKRGVLIETTLRLRPGGTVTVRFLSGDASVTLTGGVVRSTVAMFESRGEVTYHSALAFTEELTLCDDEFGVAEQELGASEPEWPAAQASSNDYTMIVMDGRTGTHDRTEPPAAR